MQMYVIKTINHGDELFLGHYIFLTSFVQFNVSLLLLFVEH